MANHQITALGELLIESTESNASFSGMWRFGADSSREC